jgi:DNA sulfur modification protein DndC
MSFVTLSRQRPPSSSATLPHAAQLDRSLVVRTCDAIRTEYERDPLPWALGFSGGKDSTALLKLVYATLLEAPHKHKQITVIYCDTRVEIPTVHQHVRETLKRVAAEAEHDRIPLKILLAQPRMGDRYFVKVIGRGYPPPSNKFRWCTDRLRIAPVNTALAAIGAGQDYTVLLGLRRGESSTRDTTIRKHRIDGSLALRQSGNPRARIFAPILHHTATQVWATINQLDVLRCIDTARLGQLYRDASGECPIVRDPQGTACAKGRFGCWTCTVVRKDRAVTGLVERGHDTLAPLLEWRNWLQSIRDDETRRCVRRRNGTRGPGPFTLAARKELLHSLLRVERRAGHALIAGAEVRAIRALWKMDQLDPRYRED